MNIDWFLKAKVIPDVFEKATIYAERILDMVESTYTKPYDETVRLLRKEWKTADEAREITGFDALKKSWGKWCAGWVSALCQKICPKENADYFQPGVYGNGILSYESGGRIYRRWPETGKKITEWADAQAQEKAKFLRQRIADKLAEKFPWIEFGKESITNVLDVSSGKESVNWTFTISVPWFWKSVVDTKLVCAGGNNIQTFHTRFLVYVK